MIDRLRRGLQDTGRIRDYLLADFDEEALLEAIRRPTADAAISFASDVPFAKYGFRYAGGVAAKIARRVVRYITQRRDSVLPLMQVICTQLYRSALQRVAHQGPILDKVAAGEMPAFQEDHPAVAVDHRTGTRLGSLGNFEYLRSAQWRPDRLEYEALSSAAQDAPTHRPP